MNDAIHEYSKHSLDLASIFLVLVKSQPIGPRSVDVIRYMYERVRYYRYFRVGHISSIGAKNRP